MNGEEKWKIRKISLKSGLKKGTKINSFCSYSLHSIYVGSIFEKVKRILAKSVPKIDQQSQYNHHTRAKGKRYDKTSRLL